MDLVAQQRFQALRKQLDSLHYCQPFNIESCALVERMLNELLKTTEAFQQIKNENAVIAQESQLNAQAQLPLQHENERLVRENNELHRQLIERKEAADQVDLRMRSTLRQAQTESQDFKFLCTQKDKKIKQLESELLKMRQKLDKVQSKLYMPGQDQVMGSLTSNAQPHNVIKGAMQLFEMNRPMDGGDRGEDDSMEGSAEKNYRGNNNVNNSSRDQEWAIELRKADQRCQEVRQRYEEVQRANQELEEHIKQIQGQIQTRDSEILRLGSMYQGGQNNEKLAQQYNYDQNRKIVEKLQSQIDFVNKENHRLQTQLDIYTKDRTVVDHIDQYRKMVDELTFENSTLRKDLKELTSMLKDYQELEFKQKQFEKSQKDRNTAKDQELHEAMKQMQIADDTVHYEKEKMINITAAFNADKKALQERVTHLEQELSVKHEQTTQMNSQLVTTKETDSNQRNELNYWNGKVQNMRRDLEMQQGFNQKLLQQNKTLKEELENEKRTNNGSQSQVTILERTVTSLQEDNSRVAAMYEQATKSNEALNSAEVESEMNASNQGTAKFEQVKIADNQVQAAKKGWQTVTDEYGSQFQNKSPGNASQTIRNNNLGLAEAAVNNSNSKDSANKAEKQQQNRSACSYNGHPDNFKR